MLYILFKTGIFRGDSSWLIIAFPTVLFFGLLILAVIRFGFLRSSSSMFFLKSLVLAFAFFLPNYKITFVATWAIEQMISLIQLFTDFAYSICYYHRS